jgi:signal transduction histidine kinase/DNA-binding response OmpR family regulator
LFKFNGYEYTHFAQNDSLPNSIPNNNCRKLLEDSQKRIWICTDNGLVFYDHTTNDFKNIEMPELPLYNFLDIYEDLEGGFWTISPENLLHLSSDGKVLEHYVVNNLSCFAFDAKNNAIWLGSESSGLSRFDIKSQQFESIPPALLSSQLEGVKTLNVRSLLTSSDGRLFIGTSDRGLLIVNLQNNSCMSLSSSNYPEAFVSNNIFSLFEDSQKKVWIGTINGKLIEFDLSSNQLAIPSFQGTNEMEEMTISCIMEDANENIWVGTHHYWMFYHDRKSNVFSLFRKQSGTLSHNTVTCFAGNSSYLLVGTDGGGLNIYDKKNGQFKTEKKFGKVILGVERGLKENEFWICTWGNKEKALFKYDPSSNSAVGYGMKENGLPTNMLRDIMVDSNYVWIATDGEGVVRLNTQTGIFDNNKNCKESIFDPFNPQWIKHIMKDGKNRIWVSSSEGIMFFQDNKATKLTIDNVSSRFIQNEIKMTFEDSFGDIYVVTSNNGLLKYDEKSKALHSMDEDYNLPNNISSICEDENHNLWFTSPQEIIKMNRLSRSTSRFNMRNDLNGRTFTPQAMVCLNDLVFVGSNNGMFIFNPSDVKTNPSNPKIYLDQLYVNGRIQNSHEGNILEKTLAFTDTLTLNHDQNNIIISFFCFQLENSENIKYQYRMEGHDNHWSDASSMRKTSYSNLPPGTYTFQVKTKVINSSYDIFSKPLTIVVLPPWWKTWWFTTIAILSVIALLYLFLYLRERRSRRKQRQLERAVEIRTEQLKAKNEEVNQQKKKLEIQNKQLDEAIDAKNKILSVIAHDLRNPLTAVVGNLSIISAKPQGDDTKHKIEQVYKSAKNLQSQMENLLDWARLQNNNILYSPKDFSLDALTKEVLVLLQDLITGKSLSLVYVDHCKYCTYADHRMVATILRNLLINAIKYSYEGGEIKVSIHETDEQIEWVISDKGVGMSSEQIEQLGHNNYSPSTFGTKNEKGSGLGFKICTIFANMNQGKIVVKSTEGEGTTITLQLPKGSTLIDDSCDIPELEMTATETDFSNQENSPMLLIADDNIDILNYLTELLQPLYKIKSANNGEEALEIAKRELPDLILSDVVMPKLSGKELCNTLKSEILTQHIPIVLLTSEDSVEQQVDGLNCGADDYITKPFSNNVLKAKIASILKNKELQRLHLRSTILKNESDKPKLDLPPKAEDTFIEQINEVIKNNIASSELTVEFLATETALSRVQLFRKMKAITGCSPSEYIKAIRLEYAADLLKYGDQNIAETAYMTGFSDPKYFSNCFSEKFGMTPSQWRGQSSKM